MRRKITFPNLEIGLFLWLPPIDTHPTPLPPSPDTKWHFFAQAHTPAKKEEKGESDGRDRIEGGGGEGGREQ